MSLEQQLGSLRLEEARDFVASLGAEERQAFAGFFYRWETWAREKQLEPKGEWRVWLVRTGRGWGKTRVGAEWIRKQVEEGKARRIALVGRTVADVRDVMVEGSSGLIAVSPPWDKPDYEPSKRRITWKNGAVATCFSADKPDQLRGPEHDTAWADELASWRFPAAWDNLLLGLRRGNNPRVVVTTTPRPTRLIRDLQKENTTHVTVGSTYENSANLPAVFLEKIIKRYEGTTLGRQELYGDLLEEAAGALWRRHRLEELRVAKGPEDLVRVVVAIDPAVTSTEESDETGIVVAATGPCRCVGGNTAEIHAFVLDDLSSRYTPDEWAGEAIGAYYKRKADRIIGEVNNGGDLIEFTLRTIDKHVAYEKVHASRGKRTRAEPIAALYQQGKVHHVGEFADLEDQLCNWEPNSGMNSPDRLDALVWSLTELMLDPSARERGDYGVSL
jgi:phage terminase large subunit-like protein